MAKRIAHGHPDRETMQHSSEIIALSAQQVCRLTGLTNSQLSYWGRTWFYSPEYAARSTAAFGRVYSFRDLVGLSVLSLLRREHGISLQELRKVGPWLRSRYEVERPWSEIRFFVDANRRLHFKEPHTSAVVAARSGQRIASTVIELEPIARSFRRDLEALRRRRPDQLGKIERRRYLMHQRPVVAGTRIPTSAIWELHEGGYRPEQILREFPTLKRQDLRSAIEFERERRTRRRAG